LSAYGPAPFPGAKGMSVFEAADFDHHETVAFFDDKPTGLHAIIAIHSTALGPACGGTRMYAYTNGDEALNDVLRLSRGMSYKSAIAGLPLGVFVGLKAAVKHRLGADNTKGLTVAIQGLGKVGMGLARQLHGEGAKLIVSDVNADAMKSATEAFGANAVSPEEISAIECDVFSPNALGAILNDRSIAQMRAKVVAGGANNQLARDEHGEALKQHGILYAPDYVINGGGIIRVAGQIFGWADAEIEHRVLGIGDTLTQIFRRADGEGVPTNVVADRMAEERMAAGPQASARAAE
jgi:leucine dehydrogenase